MTSAVRAMADDLWTENLRCSDCGKTGPAALSEISPFDNGFDTVPEGFKVVDGPMVATSTARPAISR